MVALHYASHGAVICTILLVIHSSVDAAYVGLSPKRFTESAWVENQCHGDRCGVSQLQIQQAVNSIVSADSTATEVTRKAGQWDIFGASGIKYSDVAQGELGTCYFLAVLIAIARAHPQIIDGMFINRELWNASIPVYTTRWLVDGRSVEVAVDDKVPINPSTGKLVFVQYNDGADFWPIILEKSWAKIFGAYKAVDGGTMAEAFKAITQAPVEVRLHDQGLNKERLWHALETATALNFPVCAGSRRNWVGIPSGHAYAVFNVTEVPVHGRIVLLYNPWAEDRYHGSVPNPDREDGMFHMTFDEYVASYHHTTFAVVVKGYETISRLISTHAQETTIAIEIFVDNDEPFHVQLEWPDSRFTDHCKTLRPTVTMAVAKSEEGVLEHGVIARVRTPLLPVSRADMHGGAGRYIVFLTASFPNGPWLEEVVLNVYAAKGSEFRAVNSTRPPLDYFLQMHGMCHQISVEGVGEFELKAESIVGGIPSFQQKSGGQKVIYWDPERQQDTTGSQGSFVSGHNVWKISDSMMMAHLRNPLDKSLEISQVSCTQTDWSPAVLPKEELSLSVTGRDTRRHRKSKSASNSVISTHAPDVIGQQCLDAVRRLMDLNNAVQITENGSDPLFPPDATSIGSGDEVCGDAANDIQERCSKYNHWDTFANVMAREETRAADAESALALQRKCISATPTDELCLVKNRCPQPVPVTCDTTDYSEGKSIVHHKLEVPQGASGFADIVFCNCQTFSALMATPTRVATAQLQKVSAIASADNNHDESTHEAAANKISSAATAEHTQRASTHVADSDKVKSVATAEHTHHENTHAAVTSKVNASAKAAMVRVTAKSKHNQSASNLHDVSALAQGHHGLVGSHSEHSSEISKTKHVSDHTRVEHASNSAQLQHASLTSRANSARVATKVAHAGSTAQMKHGTSTKKKIGR